MAKDHHSKPARGISVELFTKTTPEETNAQQFQKLLEAIRDSGSNVTQARSIISLVIDTMPVGYPVLTNSLEAVIEILDLAYQQHDTVEHYGIALCHLADEEVPHA